MISPVDFFDARQRVEVAVQMIHDAGNLRIGKMRSRHFHQLAGQITQMALGHGLLHCHMA
jgi:hypothetical protein